jgi:hypothetical protein
VHGLRPVAARQAQDLARAADVGRLQRRIRVDEVHHSGRVDYQVNLFRQRVEPFIGHAEQRFPQISRDGHDTLLPFWPPQPVAPQVGLDGLHLACVPTLPDEAVDEGARRGEQPFEQEGSEEACGPGQEDVIGVS